MEQKTDHDFDLVYPSSQGGTIAELINATISTTDTTVQPPRKEFKGLQNQGGTCYMNSLLQALFMTPEFRQIIFKWKYDPMINADKKDCILYQLQKLFAALQISKQPYISTTELTSSFQWDYKESFEQQDIQEFMRVLFDAVEQSFEINKIFGVVEELYSGSGTDYIKCLECGYRSDRPTKFYDLQLAVKNEYENICNDSIEKALFGYLKPEILEGDNAYQCSGCGKKVKAQKCSRLDKLPKILTLQLNRFTIDMNTWQRKKLNDRVSFPLVLNMNHFLDESKQSDLTLTQALIKQNPLLGLKSTQVVRAKESQRLKEEQLQEQAVNKMSMNFDEFVSSELGQFEGQVTTSVKGTLAQKRREEKKAKELEHKKNLEKLKKGTVKSKKPAFDRSNLNSNFFTNAKTNKDQVSGWAFDFENPDAGKADIAENQILQQVKEESMQDLSKSGEAPKTPLESQLDIRINKSAQNKAKTQQVTQAEQTIEVSDSEDTKTELSKIDQLKAVTKQNLQLIERYNQDGPFVYELFACLVHQGGAMGGHYFAYIRDYESGQWNNFNDYRVSEIDLYDLTEMFGGNKAKVVTSSSNAYMLMYKLHQKDQLEVITEEDIPAEIRQDLLDGSVQQQTQVMERQLRSQLMQLKIVKQGVDQQDLDTKIVFVNRAVDTYQTLFKMVLTQFGIKDEDNFRIRAYNVQNKIMMETFTGREFETLEMLKIYPMKTLVLEEKAQGTLFTEYDPLSIVIKINVWRSGLQSLVEDILMPVRMTVKKDIAMTEFTNLICQTFNLQQPILVMKRNPMLNQRQLELISGSDRSLNSLRVNEGVNLFVETRTDHSKWEQEFELDQNRLTVKYNKLTDQGEVVYKELIIVDKRMSILDLKIKIAEKLGVGLGEVVFKRGGSYGTELIEDDQSLKQAQFYNMICVYLQAGIPSKVGQVRLKIFLAEPYSGNFDFEDVVLDNQFFTFRELAEIPVRTNVKTIEAKKQILDLICGLCNDLGLSNDDVGKIILRDKSGEDKLTQVYHNDRELSRYQIYDGKEIAIQIVSKDFTSMDSFLLMVKLWDPETWQLSVSQELSVPKTATLHQFAELISKVFAVELQTLQVCKISSSWNFSRVQLPYEQWQSMSGNQNFIASAPFYVSTDGLLFVIRDRQKKERQMTDEEIVKFRCAEFEYGQFKQGDGVSKMRQGGAKERAMKITVKGKDVNEDAK